MTETKHTRSVSDPTAQQPNNLAHYQGTPFPKLEAAARRYMDLMSRLAKIYELALERGEQSTQTLENQEKDNNSEYPTSKRT